MGLGVRSSQPILEEKPGGDGMARAVHGVLGSCCSISAAGDGKGQARSSSPASLVPCTGMEGACVQGADGHSAVEVSGGPTRAQGFGR